MVSLVLFIFLVIFCVSLFIFIKTLYETGYLDEEINKLCLVLSIIFGILSVIFLCWEFILINTVATSSIIDERIAMYQSENAAIEENIDTIVKNYMEFESNTFDELKDTDSISLISLFPELKSDTLIQKQIEIYIANNNEIKSLKEEQIYLTKSKWYLYFGN